MKQLLLKSKKSNLPFSITEKKQAKKSSFSITTNMLKCLFVVLSLTPFAEVSAQINSFNMVGLSGQPTSGYSLRRLSSNYQGSAIQVRRTGDNATKDIGFMCGCLNNRNRDLDTTSLLAFTDAGNVWDAGVSISGANLYYNKQLSNGDLLVASYNTNRIHRSTDNGLTWDAGVLVASGAGIRGITQLANGNVLATGYLDNKVYRSTDNGATWDAGTLIAAGAGLSGITQLSNGHVLALGTLTNIVYRSTDNGATWDSGVLVAAGAGLSGITQLSNGTLLVTGNTSNKIYRSADNGATWDAGTTIAGASLTGVTQLASGHVVAVDNTVNKIYRSTNNGITWDAGSLVASGVGIVGISQLANGDVIASATNGSIYKSTKLSAFVRIWYDQSGRNLQATQASVFLQPRIVNAGVIETANGKPAVYFAGSDFLLCNSPTPFPTTGFSGFTANIVAKWTTVGTSISSSQTLIDNNFNGTTQGFVIRDRPDLPSKPTSFGITVAPGTLSTVSDNTQTGNGTTRVLSFGADNTTVSGFKEGFAMATSAISGTNYALQSTLGIGASFNNGVISNYLTGHISEIIILPVTMNRCTFPTLERDQGNYYGISVAPVPQATVGPASASPTVCVNTPMVNITHLTTSYITGIGNTFGGSNNLINLPPGVTASFASNTLTISGTPTAVGVFYYTIFLLTTDPCNSSGPPGYTATSGIISVISNSVSAASATPTVCTNSVMQAINHTTTGVTGIGSATNLPPGVSAAFSNNTITISGTPTAAGTYNYTIPLTGGCGAVNATGTITVSNTGTSNTVGAASSTPTLCVGSVLTTITHTTTGATGIGTATGLPAGVTASWANNVVSISGSPTASGTFPYSIPLIGGCGAVNATGTITVNSSGAANTAGAASSSPTVCAGQALPNITHATTGATGIAMAQGLPAGLTASWAGNVITISGTPVGYGTYNYAIPLTGGCGTVSATGTITINTPQPYITSSLPITAVGTVSSSVYYNWGNLDGTGSNAATSNFRGVVADAVGNLYATDPGNHNIRKITPAGVMTTVAGSANTGLYSNGIAGFVNATGAAARFNNPQAIAIDRFGNLFVSDNGNNVIRKITPGGVVSTYAGTGAVGNTNGPALSATFNSPRGLATDAAGNVYVADAGNRVIRIITPAGIVSNFAGSGASGTADGPGAIASFKVITGICSDAVGNIYLTDGSQLTVRKVTPSGMVSTIAGTGFSGSNDGFGQFASFRSLGGITADAVGNIYVFDQSNYKIRRITPEGLVSTLAGSGFWGYDDGVGTVASFSWITGITIDPSSGNLHVVDDYGYYFRKIVVAETLGACIGEAVVLTANGGTGYTWSGPQAITNGVSFTVTTAGTHTVTVSNGSCSPITRAITVNVNQPTVTAASNPSVCVSTILPTITRTTTVATGIGAATGLPTGVTATWAANVLTISGIPTDIGTFNYSIPLLGGCPFNATGTITVNDNTVSAASSSPTLCINTPLTPITHTTTGATGISIILGLPAGVTAAWASNTITISGTPTQMGTFNYSIRLAGGCGIDYATGTIRVTSNSVTNTAGSAASSPTVCINTALTNITFATTLATGIGAPTGLPTGVTANWASNVITISGTPTVSGTFPYSIPLTGGCGVVNATGTITVTANNTITLSSAAGTNTQTRCINTAITTITYATTGATGIGVATGLPAGVTATWASNTITISGTPTASGTFNYSIPLTGGCGTITATGTITVTPTNTAGVASSTPTVNINTALTSITHATTGATGIGAATGLPTGVTATWASNTITISGTPTVVGIFNYSIPLVGGCGAVNATGTITVTRDTDGDGVGDTADGDDDNDGIIDTLECCIDSDGDGVADTLDIDDDNDGIPDIEEAGFKAYSNGKSIMDRSSAATWVDANANGINDFIDAMITAGTYLLPDTDGDGVPNYRDLDSDNDSLFDVDEANLLNGDGDSNGDGKGDGLDTDGDGLLNLYDNSASNGTTARAYAQDTDANGTPDYMQLDSNNDGVNDIADTLYSALDTNNDGKIDGTVDVDNDGLLDAFDTNTAVKGSPRNLNRKLYLDFDGRNDYGQDATALGVLANETIMAWIDLNSTFSATGVVAGQPGFQLRINSSRNLEAVVNGTTVTFNTTALNTSQWYHVGAVYNGSTVKLYLNGVMVASGAASGNIASAVLTLGKNPSADSNYFRGKIDEVRIFDVALTDLQFQRMVYQEVQNTGSQVRGTIVPKDIQSLPYANLLRNYRMDAYTDDIVDDVTTATIDTGTGMKIYNHKAIKVQEAPIPFVTRTTGTFATAINDPSKDIRGLDVMDFNYSIVQVKHDISETANVTNLAMFVDPNITITMNNDTKIQNDWYLKLDGKIDLVGKSQLIQTANSDLDATSAGFAERDQQGNRKLFNYNYWSSPVSSINNSTVNHGFTVNGVMKDGTTATPQNITWTSGINGAATSPITLSSYWIFKFQNSTNTYANWSSVGQNGILLPGQGFTMKGSGVSTPNQNYTFVGKPNNGTITSTVGANNLNLCGNPYPSAIDADQFIDDNVASINGTLFFWEHFDTNSSHNTIEYQGGYATYTKVGGTAPVAPLGTSGLGSSSKTPNRFIPVGQGFFVTGSPTGGTITFNNGQRLFVKEDNENSYSLFRTNANPTVSSSAANYNANDSFTTEEFMKLRLGYTSTNNYHRQILLGFMEQNATAGYDEGYDGISIETLTNDMYFINGTRKLNINGDGFFNVNNIYPIGVKNATSGNVTFEIDGKENFSDSQEIYIHDNVTNTYNSIKSQPYQVNLPAGIYDTRFTLRFTNGSSLGTTDNEENQGIAVLHSQSNNMITIKNVLQQVTVKSVSLFNLLGQQVTNWKIDNQNQAEIQLKVSDVSAGTYIVKVFTDGGEITKKILVKK